ncbi:MAG TPA: hypothetical protein VF765_08965 [Polyangiaceae bacterium]
MAEPKIKGAAIREFLLWHDQRYGHAETVSLTEGVPPSLLKDLDTTQPALGILGASWYPCSLIHPMLDHIVEARGNEGRELANAANREVVPKMLRGVYRMIFRTVATPELYARHIHRLWRRLHTTGDRSLTIREPGEALSVVENWPGHHPLVCWTTIYTMAYVFEAMGYPHWSVERIACIGHGAPRCETILRYKR